MIAFIVRVHDAAEGLAGVVELPGSTRTSFRSGDELLASIQRSLDDARAAASRSGTEGRTS